MSINWMRHFELQLYANNGKGISLSEFKATFDVERNDNRFPCVGTVRVYNLSQSTQNKIMAREFTKIRIIAGYDGIAPAVTENDVGKERYITDSQVGKTDGQNFGVIFSGDIRFTITGKDNGTDSWITIQACDSEEAFNFAKISTTLAKGYTTSDVYDLLMRHLEPYGIAHGITPNFPTTVFPRGRVFHGMVRD